MVLLKSLRCQEDHATLAQIWRGAVQDYASRKLTLSSDIFPAISGIAHKFSQDTGAHYIAGLWRDWLAEDLIWSCKSIEGTRKATPWRAPTFSWASQIYESAGPVQRFVEWRFSERIKRDEQNPCQLTTHIDVVETSSTSKGIDDFGELISAHIILRGTLVQAIVTGSPTHRTPWDIRSMTASASTCLLFFPDYNFDIPEGDSSSKDNLVFCLKICTISQPDTHGQYSYSVFLVLKKVGEITEDGEISRCGVYERVGLIQDPEISGTSFEGVSSSDMVTKNATVKII
jgi:hypothetical protein